MATATTKRKERPAPQARKLASFCRHPVDVERMPFVCMRFGRMIALCMQPFRQCETVNWQAKMPVSVRNKRNETTKSADVRLWHV